MASPRDRFAEAEDVIPTAFLGEEDAETEWRRAEKPLPIFLPTPAYAEFKEPGALYLFGRRGTGKTTILQMLRHEIRSNDNPNYSHVWLINSEEAYHELSIQLRTSALGQLPQSDMVHLLVQKWMWVLQVSAMLAVVRVRDNDSDRDVAVLRAYLEHERLMRDEDNETKFDGSPFSRLVTILQDELKAIDYAPAKIAGAITSITGRFVAPRFMGAREALTRVLKHSKKSCLVLVDSIEQYNLRDDIAQAVMTALIEAVKRLYDKHDNDRIVAKAAFPSEIYPHLAPVNKEKTVGKNLFIVWRYRDLVGVLAKRYWQLINGAKSADSFEQLNDFRTAKSFLYQHFPESVVSRAGIPVETLAYLVRHTLKKPRQVIVLANVVLTVAQRAGEDIRGSISPEAVVAGVHARLDLLVSGSLDMYEQIYPNSVQFVRRTLTRAQSQFDYATLDSLMKEVSALRAQSDMSLEDVRRLLFECGALGLEGEKHALRESGKVIVEVLFEYQVKRILTFTNRQRCAVHPMFYQDLQIDVDPDIFAYPRPAEEEEREDLRRSGVLLV